MTVVLFMKKWRMKNLRFKQAILKLSFLLIFIPNLHVQAQNFNFDGTYLTEDTSQSILGFDIDQENNRIVVLGQPYLGTFNNNYASSQSQRFSIILNYLNNQLDWSTMTKEEKSVFNEKHQMDYATLLRNYADNELNAEIGLTDLTWDMYLDLQLPGIYNWSQKISRNQLYGQYIVINQPTISFNQSYWEITLFELPSAVLRFEANTDKSQLRDDFGVIYHLQEETINRFE